MEQEASRRSVAAESREAAMREVLQLALGEGQALIRDVDFFSRDPIWKFLTIIFGA